MAEVLAHILVAFREFLFGELSHLALHHALFVPEQAVRSAKEALQSHNFLEEPELRVGLLGSFLALLMLDGLLDSGVDLCVDLRLGKSGDVGLGSDGLACLLEGGLDEGSDLLNMSLSIDLSRVDP